MFPLGGRHRFRTYVTFKLRERAGWDQNMSRGSYDGGGIEVL